jgi:RNA polymerase sigma-70 factor (ECF subfamily)
MQQESVFNKTTSASFDQTAWTMVLEAAGQQNQAAHAALERMCGIYWPPLYTYLRRQGQSPEDAKDLTQGFFQHLLSGKRLGSVHPAKGKFRTFLLACLNNYVRNEWDKGRAKKRGGGQEPLSFSISEEETRNWEPADNDDPAKIFEQKWAAQLIAQVFKQLEANCGHVGKSRQFQVLTPFLNGEAPRGGYAEAAASLQMSEGAARVAASRLRDEFRNLLRTEVGMTVSDPSEIDDEINYLIAVWKRP